MAENERTVSELDIIEQNGIDHVGCPNCSKMYPIEDFKGYQEISGIMQRVSEPLDIPGTCKRCGSPMDEANALAFANAEAANYGKGLPSPPRRTQILRAANK